MAARRRFSALDQRQLIARDVRSNQTLREVFAENANAPGVKGLAFAFDRA